MKRYILTSPLIYGSVDLVYSDTGLIQKVDFELTTAPMVNRKGILSRVAKFPLCEEIASVIEGTQATIVEADFEVSFEMFWKKYNKKINKFRCIKLWEKMEKTMQVKSFYGIEQYDKYLKKEGWRTKADPETYLRNQYWENEYK